MSAEHSIVVQQCDELAQAVRQLRNTFRSSISVKHVEFIDRFWAVQDHLHRLVALLSDDPTKVSEVKQRYGSLIPDVIDVLSFTAKTTVGQLPAVALSCRSIHDLLLEIQSLKQASPVASSCSA
jgi:hypothetical protein